MSEIIFGITGTNGAGKGSVVNILTARGFAHFSMSGFIVEEIKRRGLPVNRDSMRDVGNRIRKDFGPDYIATQLYARATENGGNAIIESLRTEAEVTYLQDQPHFCLIGTDAPPEIRYDRVTARGSEKDKVTYEQFVAQERLEMTNTDPAKQNLSRCMGMADYVINNDGTLEDLEKEVDRILNEIKDNK